MIRDTSATDTVVEPKHTKKSLVILSIVVLLLAFVSANAFFSSEGASLSVDKNRLQIATLEVGDLTRDVLATGKIVAASAPQLYSPEQGFVTLHVRAGDTVEKGQLVAEVESPELNSLLEQENAEMLRLEGELAREELTARRQTLELTKLMDLAEVDLQAAKREERRAKASIVNNVISQIDLEKAIDDLARAKLNHKHAEQEVSLAKDTLAFELENARQKFQRQVLIVQELKRKVENLSIVASVDGVVGNLLIQERALVNKNAPLMTLVDLSAYEAQLQVPESYANELGLGMEVEVSVQGQTKIGKLVGISPEVSNREVTARVRFNEEDVSGLRQNQQISARVLLENKSQVLKVRRGSFMQAGGFVAYKVEGDIAQKVSIQTGASSMREIEILSGLAADDQIIISNYENFINEDRIYLN
uniref:efflux RND transporter periplasmic adaptor subunit n=1 Tax=Ningiella ruwaisensis TaxID=2364274 RepID=UPI00109F8901|nr:HlyD family efflux transporter periplasmic adaptor subunit [Ningiella ruwaisensis]